ncbi:hypothetical protein HJG60_011177 [Phyllostomus discolor]|uniref:Uncharacterized protein n=1 Tax=Phyllostomus discolor TaxID=89673 RepID=A0A834A3Z6_9CHIR|nr:hypothetical protein HJG60_011177 [Phyllostomus discolor]
MRLVPTEQFAHCGCGQSSQSAILRVNLTHGCANSNQGFTSLGGHTQPTQEILLDHLAQVVMDIVPLGPTGHLLNKATLPRLGDITIYLIHRNKHKEVAKMERQRNMPQIKKQEKSPEKELNEMKASALPDIEFKTVVIKVLKELSENFNSLKKDIETIKYQSEMTNTITEINNTLEGINNGLDGTEDQSSYLEDKIAENT